jgi:hypothetical protein
MTNWNSAMAQYTKSVPKNPADSDDTLDAVLEVIIFQTQDGDELVGFQNKKDQVVLTFEGED